MKLLLFNDFRVGVLKGDQVVDVTSALPRVEGLRDGELAAEGTMEALIEGFSGMRGKLEEAAAKDKGVPISDVTVRAPLPRAHSVLCAFANYMDSAEPRPLPVLDFFHKSPTSIVQHEGTVELPDIPEAVVFQPEPELGYVIGRRARMVSENEALDYVFGYLNFVDVSARGIPNRRTTFFHKSLDTWAPMGPVIVTKDEVPDPQNMQVRLWLNGELKQDYPTSAMSHSIAAQITWLSTYITLMPGDVISCGTHHRGLSPINDGDTVEVEIEPLERLRFKVKSHGPVKTAHWRPPGTQE